MQHAAILECVSEAMSVHTTAREQIACARVKVKALPDYGDFVDNLVDEAIQSLVYDQRHRQNCSIKYTGDTGTSGAAESKVKVGGCKAVADAYADYFSYTVGGKRLADVYGEELADLADAEMVQSQGHAAKAALFRSLADVVRPGKQVKDAVSGARLKRMFEAAGI